MPYKMCAVLECEFLKYTNNLPFSQNKMFLPHKVRYHCRKKEKDTNDCTRDLHGAGNHARQLADDRQQKNITLVPLSFFDKC